MAQIVLFAIMRKHKKEPLKLNGTHCEEVSFIQSYTY